MSSRQNIMPNVWGAGQLFAFSGVDGKTDHAEPFVFQTDAEPGSLVQRLPVESRIRFDKLPSLRFSMILGDAITADSAQGAFRCAFSDHHTLVGELSAGAELIVGGQKVDTAVISIGKNEKLEVFAVRDRHRWAIAAVPLSKTSQAGDFVRQALQSNLDEVIAKRTAYVRNVPLPEHLDDWQVKLLRKAISVMKVNVESPCGQIKRRWTTPDRWPHRNMWLWDSAFHGIGLALVDPALGQEVVLAMLEQVREDGMLAHMVTPTEKSDITQPPVLAWSAWTLLEKTHDRDWAKACAPYLFRYLEWIRTNRDKNGNGLLEWFIEGNALCRSGESGMDNSSRFDSAVLLDAPDFSALLGHDYRCLARLAEAIGDASLQRTCTEHADRIGQAVQTLLWSESDQLFMDRLFDGTFSTIKASSGFAPLLAGFANRNQAEALREHLKNPGTFGTPLPIPSVSLDDGTFCKDMWRGPAWINYNYMVCVGLRRYGFVDDAQRLKDKTLAAIDKWYAREGCLFEFYDCLDLTSPRRLDRKQQLARKNFYDPISDYHWTAALTTAMLLE